LIQASNILSYEQSVAEQEENFCIVTWLALSWMSTNKLSCKKKPRYLMRNEPDFEKTKAFQLYSQLQGTNI